MEASKLHSLFDYSDGLLLWKKTGKGIRGDKIAGNVRPDGYRSIRIEQKAYLAHRLIFLFHHGYMPKYIDHKDGDPTNNRIENLRESTHSQNMMNSKVNSVSRSKIKNVRWNNSCSKWQVLIQVMGKQRHIGVYKDLELAELVAIEARNKYHGEFAKHN